MKILDSNLDYFSLKKTALFAFLITNFAFDCLWQKYRSDTYINSSLSISSFLYYKQWLIEVYKLLIKIKVSNKPAHWEQWLILSVESLFPLIECQFW